MYKRQLQLGPEWKYIACSIGFIVNYAAYFAEIYRSGIQSIPRGQYDAASVLGYSKTQTFMKIVLPQVVQRILRHDLALVDDDHPLAHILHLAQDAVSYTHLLAPHRRPHMPAGRTVAACPWTQDSYPPAARTPRPAAVRAQAGWAAGPIGRTP